MKYMYDMYADRVKIVASGSSAFYLDTKFDDSLAGRKRIFQLKHLDFEEFLQFKEREDLWNEIELISENQDYISLKRNDIQLLFEEYLAYGGYPAVVLEDDIEEKIYRLQELRNSYLKKDIKESGVGHEMKFYHLVQLLAEQCGNLVNRNELANTLQIDNKTIERYLFILQKSFHIHLIHPFSSNLRNEITKMPKIYFCDTGFRNVFLNRFESTKNRTDKGAIIENYICNRLINSYSIDNVKFWRSTSNSEVDFIVSKAFNDNIAYEVKYSGSQIKHSKYKAFCKQYPEIPLHFIAFEQGLIETLGVFQF